MEYLGHKIKKIDQLFKLRMNRNLEELDITNTQMHILAYLIHNKQNKITQKLLAEEFDVKHSTMSGILSRLKEKELIEIKVDEENKKYRLIFPTSKAFLLDKRMILHRDETEAIFLRGFTDKEKMILSTYLDRLYDNLVSYSDFTEQDIECLKQKKAMGRRNINA